MSRSLKTRLKIDSPANGPHPNLLWIQLGDAPDQPVSHGAGDAEFLGGERDIAA